MPYYPDALEMECKLAFIQLASQQDPDDTPIDLYADGFWAGVKAHRKQRTPAQVRPLLDAAIAAASGDDQP